MNQFNTIKKQERREAILRIIKKFVSWVLAVPALIIVIGDSKDLGFFWIKLVAIFVLIAVLKWNHAFDEPNNMPKGRE